MNKEIERCFFETSEHGKTSFVRKILRYHKDRELRKKKALEELDRILANYHKSDKKRALEKELERAKKI